MKRVDSRSSGVGVAKYQVKPRRIVLLGYILSPLSTGPSFTFIPHVTHDPDLSRALHRSERLKDFYPFLQPLHYGFEPSERG